MNGPSISPDLPEKTEVAQCALSESGDGEVVRCVSYQRNPRNVIHMHYSPHETFNALQLLFARFLRSEPKQMANSDDLPPNDARFVCTLSGTMHI